MRPLPAISKQNKTEARYERLLTHRKLAGEIVDYAWEPFKIIIAPNIPKVRKELTYKPDFLVVFTDRFEFHEVKGHMRPQALVRMKASAARIPWIRFIIVRDIRGQWEYEEL